MDKWLESKIPQHRRATSGQESKPEQSKKDDPNSVSPTLSIPGKFILCVIAFWIFVVGLRLVTHEVRANHRAAERIAEKQRGGELQRFEEAMQAGLLKPKEKTPAK